MVSRPAIAAALAALVLDACAHCTCPPPPLPPHGFGRHLGPPPGSGPDAPGEYGPPYESREDAQPPEAPPTPESR